MKKIYCKNCKKFFFEADLFVGKIVCRRCDEPNVIKFISQQALLTLEQATPKLEVDNLFTQENSQ